MAYTSDSASDRLAAVRAAMAAIMEGGQGWTLRQRSQQLARLADLRKIEKELQDEVVAEGTNGGNMAGLGAIAPVR